MTVVTRTCSAPTPAVEAIEALAKIAGIELTATEEDATVSLVTNIENKFTGISNISRSEGFVQVAKSIVEAAGARETGLWGTSTDSSVLVQEWIERAVAALVAKKDASKFALTLEQHLESKSDSESKSAKTYLVGDNATAADVLAAIWLSQLCADATTNDTLPKATFSWMSNLLGKLGLELPASLQPRAAAAAAAAATTSTTTVVDQLDNLQIKSSSLSLFADNAIVQKLVSLNIDHQVYGHLSCNTAEELVKNVPLPDDATHTHTKNLFLRDKKHGLFLVCVHPDTAVNTKELGKMLQLAGKTNLRFADASILQDKLNCVPGTVGPLAICNDTEGDVTLVMDQKILAGGTYTHIHSHPLRNDASVIMTPDQCKDFFQKVNHQPTVLEFAAPGASAPPTAGNTKGGKPKKDKKPEGAPKTVNKDKKTAKKGDTLLALQWKKEENFPMWYSDVIVLSEMISYYDISGCYILRPWSYKIWELIQGWFNEKIAQLDVENCYFPLFVSQDRLEKEKDHVEGFAPEVAWVTKSGEDDLARPIAIRPTSETIMYPAFSDWIKSHRDLPLKINQWSNVVRWEFKDPTPFLRSREFLWQEGHTAHVDHQDADKMVMEALGLYRDVYQDLLAVPVIPGYKTEKEKFAGGHQTTTVEAYIPGSGRAIQGATSHNLGTNFGKMFDISFQDANGKAEIPWQTSWGITTRSIGVMVMVHGDDTGLVMPPRISPLQAVIVPIISKKLTSEVANPYCEEILKDLRAAGLRAKLDDRVIYNPGWKYNHWEQKGVPIRIEVGPRDMEQKMARIVVRYNGEKLDMPIDNLGETLKGKLEEIQKNMFEKAKHVRDQHLVQVTEWKDFVPNLELNNLVMTPWCGGTHQDWEEWVKNKSREESLGDEVEEETTATSVAAKTLCIPFDQPDLPEGTKCIASGMDATCWVLWGRSY